ncbi:MAG TPA: AAA family ATPase [Polyangium sp.]|nr:AAA family ATPase [Polyangium sp.]
MMKRTVFISGCPGSGKSFLGDYLETMCGFSHVDGDIFILSKESRHVELKNNLFEAHINYWIEKKSAPRELWQPYYQELFGLVEKAHEKNSNVVVSAVVLQREVRDYLRAQLPNHIFILLVVSENELVERRLRRLRAIAESQKKNMAQAYKDMFNDSYSDDTYLKRTQKVLQGLQPIENDEVLSFTIDAGTDEKYKSLHEALQLPPPQPVIPVEDIASINYERWKRAYFPIECRA